MEPSPFFPFRVQLASSTIKHDGNLDLSTFKALVDARRRSVRKKRSLPTYIKKAAYFFCNQLGHTRRDCPLKAKEKVACKARINETAKQVVKKRAKANKVVKQRLQLGKPNTLRKVDSLPREVSALDMIKQEDGYIYRYLGGEQFRISDLVAKKRASTWFFTSSDRQTPEPLRRFRDHPALRRQSAWRPGRRPR
jgi:hypothetical protein